MMARYSMVPILSPGGANKGGGYHAPIICYRSEDHYRGKMLASQHLRDFRGTSSDDLGVLTFDQFIVSDGVLVHHHRHVTPWPL